MNKPKMHWSAALTALALTMAAPAYGQESTGDPFLDAMMMDQQAAKEDVVPAEKPQSNAFDEAAARTETAAGKAPQQVETKLVSAASDTRLLDEADVLRELGPTTGLFQNDASFDGKRVAGVELSYTGDKVLPDQRLLDVVQTRAGSEYSSVRVNADLERLKDLGVNDLYIGYETGLDDVLTFMNKGTTLQDSLEQAQRLNNVGIHHHNILSREDNIR